MEELILFRQNNPAHDMTIRILENQGQRNIAPFLVNAVLHYVQCTETPDIDVKKFIYPEEQGFLHDKVGRNKYVQSKNVIGDDMRSMIARTLSAFRSEEL